MKWNKFMPRAVRRKGTISGMIIALVSLLLFAILLNVFYPLIDTITVGLDPMFKMILNFALIIIGVGIIVEIILDASRGSNPYGGNPYG